MGHESCWGQSRSDLQPVGGPSFPAEFGRDLGEQGPEGVGTDHTHGLCDCRALRQGPAGHLALLK